MHLRETLNTLSSDFIIGGRKNTYTKEVAHIISFIQNLFRPTMYQAHSCLLPWSLQWGQQRIAITMHGVSATTDNYSHTGNWEKMQLYILQGYCFSPKSFLLSQQKCFQPLNQWLNRRTLELLPMNLHLSAKSPPNIVIPPLLLLQVETQV